MAAITMARKFCVNDHVVPVKSESLTWVDPYGKCDEALESLVVLDASLVNFGSSAGYPGGQWLWKTLAIPDSKWWKYNHGRIPLLREIQHLIQAAKNQSGQKRGPGNSDALVPLLVRGRVLWFLNSLRCVVLALVHLPKEVKGKQNGKGEADDQAEDLADADLEAADLQWFLRQLSSDIQSLSPVAPDVAPPDPGTLGEHESDSFDAKMDEALLALSEHPECVSAKYWSSRSSIAVSRICDHSKKEFRLKSLKRTRAMAEAQDNETSLVNLIDAAKLRAFQFLEEAPGDILFNL